MSNPDSDQQAARREYWTRSNDEAWRFMFEDILPYPVQKCGEAMVSLADAARFAGAKVFFNTSKHVRNLDRLFYLRAGQIPGFVAACQAFNEKGLAIRVEDGFRTREMQKFLGRTPAVFDAILERVVWELNGELPTPDFMFRRCSGLVATVPKFGTHMSGSAIDISVVQLNHPDQELDCGAPYLEMSELTPMASPFVSPQAQKNRREITAIMRAHGFVEYPYEFWHYSSGDAYDQFLHKSGKAATYGAIDWDQQTGKVEAFKNPNEHLNAQEEIQAEIARALQARSKSFLQGEDS